MCLNKVLCCCYSPVWSVLWGSLLRSWLGKQGHSPSHFTEIVFPDRQLWNSNLHCKKKHKQYWLWGLYYKGSRVETRRDTRKLVVVLKDTLPVKIAGQCLVWLWRGSLKCRKSTWAIKNLDNVVSIILAWAWETANLWETNWLYMDVKFY